jgi:hypothetical protein
MKDNSGQFLSASCLEMLKGVHFCLADDARHFSLHGSIYYNEEDWAANADYGYSDDMNLLTELSDELIAMKLDPQLVQDIVYIFTAFVLLKTLRTSNNSMQAIANVGLALSYCDGDYLILGDFVNHLFRENIKIISEYENPSTAPVRVSKPTAPCGDLWEYLKFNYAKFLQEQGLIERFLEFGEAEAQRISECFKDQLFINECPICGNIKKTPRARLCLKCGDFTFPNS